VLRGRRQAMVLAAVAEPAGTRSLARQLSLAPSTVSEHLATLLQADLVSR
jgi:DNA-binding MarR family transcriptional regulator